ncbi:MAG: Beta-galactosidase C-terminal domain [Treponema sp.]|uniref:alpha-amylase family glycosyl hydrolase n=1 Tax=Treponema sp. TaxID=166 RepID=UPI0025E27C12|nr:alpha-amylase family glycosyl hydrolase [Treponema sp.]MBR0494823.1 Beta-galactosidase C-terminal domain [Treponema sp.]
MKIFDVKKIFVLPLISALVFAGIVTTSCKTADDSDSGSATSATVSYGSLSVTLADVSQSGRAVYTTGIKTAVVTVKGYDTKGSSFTKTSACVSVSDGKASGITVNEIPVCNNAVVSVQAFSDDSANYKIEGITISAVKTIVAGKNEVSVSWDSSRKGNVYSALISAGVNTNSLTQAQISSIDNAIPGNIHASLIDSAGIASAFKAGNLASSDSYKLTAGTLKVTCNEFNGCTLQLSDPLSAISTAIVNNTVTISNAAPGTWTIYVLDGTTIKASKKVRIASGKETAVTVGNFSGIQIQVAKSLGFDLIHYWDCSDAENYPNTKWPGTEMLSVWSDDDYVFNFAGCSSVSLLITKADETKLCADDIVISAPGAYRITSSGASTSSYIERKSSNPPVEGKIVSDPNELRIYQVMVASFQDGDPSRGYTQMWGPDNALKGGDLQGIINALDYIKELGCNALWMTPIFQSSGFDERLEATGYFATDYFNIDNHFGTNEKFAELVTKCHEKGISVILDGVFGHNGASQGGTMQASPNRTGIKNPGKKPDTNNPVNYAGNPDSLKYYSDVASYWITEYKIDGWRLDQCYQVGLGDKSSTDNTGAGGHNYWYDIRKVVEEAASSNGTKGNDWGTLGYMVGEHWNGDQTRIQAGSVASGTANGYGLNSCFDFPAYYQVVQGFAQEYGDPSKSTDNITTGLSYLYKTYSEKGYSCLEDNGSYEPYYPNFMLSNHDLYRIGDVIKDKWNCAYDSSEYIGRNKVLLAAQCAYTGPITIYYGDEIGDHSTDLSGWGGDNVARSSGKITGFDSREQAIHDWTQKCLSVRASHEALWNGSNTQITGESDFYVAKKIGGGETIYIAFNYSSSPKTFSASGKDLLSDTTFSGTVTVPSLSAVYILEQ